MIILERVKEYIQRIYKKEGNRNRRLAKDVRRRGTKENPGVISPFE